MSSDWRALVLGLVGPMLAFAGAFGAATWLLQESTGASPEVGEALLAGALEDLTWNHGSPADVRAVLQKGKVTRPDSAEQREHAVRTRLRLTVVAETPDARAALLSEVCAFEPPRCESLPQELESVAATRPGPREYHLVAPPTADQR